MKDWLDIMKRAGSATLFILGAANEQAMRVKAEPQAPGFTVNATGTDRATACAGVQDFLFKPAATLAQMQVSYTCPDDGKRRVCRPAAATPPAEPGTPAVAMYPSAYLVSLACDPAHFEIESPRLQVSVDGIDETCPSITSIHTTVIAADQCVAGAGSTAATCLRWTCEGSPIERACFPLRPVATSASPIGSGATTSTVVLCEQALPLLLDGFD